MARTQLTGYPVTIGQDLNTNSSTANMRLGAYSVTNDGRGFRYVKAGAVDLVPGKLQQSPAQDTTNLNPSGGLGVSVAQAIGDTSITISTSITLTANQLAGYFLSVNVTPGQGYTYRILGNTAVTAAAGAVITLDDPLQVALTTSSKVVVAISPFNGVIVNPTTATGAPVGVATTIISATQFGWIQTHGVVGVLNDSSTAVGLGVAPSAAVAGAVKTAAATTALVGYAVNTGVTTEYDLVFLTID